MQSSGASRCENAESYSSIVMPRFMRVQDAVMSYMRTTVSGILDRPLSRATTTEIFSPDMASRSRGAMRPKSCISFRPRGRGECRVPNAPAASCALG